MNFSPEISELLLKIILLLCKKCFPAEYRSLTADWDESECNRNENGEFAEKPGGEAGESETDALRKTILHGIMDTGVSVHAKARMKERGIEIPQVIDAVKNPLQVEPVKTDEQGRSSVRFIGKQVTACFNPNNGNLITAWPTKHQLRKKYGGG